MKGAVFTLSEEAGLVCRMEVGNRKAKFTSENEEVVYNFGSRSSWRKFDGNEMKYIKTNGKER